MKKDSVISRFLIGYALIGIGTALLVLLSLIKKFGDYRKGNVLDTEGVAYYFNVAFFCGLLGFYLGERLFSPSENPSPHWLRVTRKLSVLVWAAILIIIEIRFRLLTRGLSVLSEILDL